MYFGRDFVILAKVALLGIIVVFGQIGCIGAKRLYSGKVVVFGQNWLYSGNIVVCGKNWL